MTRRFAASTFALVAALLFAAPPARGLDEEFHYRWQLRNFVGRLAGLFLPSEGNGSLAFKSAPNGTLRSELLITSPQSAQGEYFRYGAEVDEQTLHAVRVWSSYQWRGETKSKGEDIRTEGVLDIASGIFSIRRTLPKTAQRMEIWSDGRIYPVVVVPQETSPRVIGKRRVLARHYSIRGLDVPGRNRWKGKLDLWLTLDGDATPVEITISRNLADVRLELRSGS